MKLTLEKLLGLLKLWQAAKQLLNWKQSTSPKQQNNNNKK